MNAGSTGPAAPGGGDSPSRSGVSPVPAPDADELARRQAAAVRPLLDAVAIALLDCTPAYWTAVCLRVEREMQPRGKEVTSVFLSSPEGYAEPVVDSPALRAAVQRLWKETFQRGQGWRRMVFDATRADGKEWDYKVDLKYG
jgi:hypothetical protein